MEETQAAIQAMAPELNLRPRRYQPNPHFARGELPRLAMDIMREVGEPVATREIAPRVLASKAVALPDRYAMKRTRRLIGQLFAEWGRRGWVRTVGEGKRCCRYLG